MCAFLLTVGECTHPVESGFPYEIHKLTEIILGFAGKAHHKRSAQAYAGNLASYPLYKLTRLRSVEVAAHTVEHRIGNVLERDVKIFANVVAPGHHRKYVIREICRIGIMQTYPFHSLYIGHTVYKLRQRVPPVYVHAVIRQVLRYYVELLDPLSDELSRLLDYLAYGARSVPARD